MTGPGALFLLAASCMPIFDSIPQRSTEEYAPAQNPASYKKPDKGSMDVPHPLGTPLLHKKYFSVGTNALPWAATVMNIAGEVQVSGHISVMVPVWWCPWFISDKHSLRILAFQPEARWWFDTPGSRHFIGPHVSVAWFNVKHNDIRYQDRGRPELGAGLTYGYSLPLGKAWTIEFSIGAGYLSLRYDRFHNVVNGALIDTRQTSYWGIDHAGISVVYHITR